MKRSFALCCTIPALLCLTVRTIAQQPSKYNGIDANLGNIFRLSDAKTRSISPENFNGAKGEGGKATTGAGGDNTLHYAPCRYV